MNFYKLLFECHTGKTLLYDLFKKLTSIANYTNNHIYPLYVLLFFHLTLDIRVSTMLQLQYIENILQKPQLLFIQCINATEV